jgi:Domain of unknown function (DUF6456)
MSDDLDRDALRLLTRLTGRDRRLARDADNRFRFTTMKRAGGRTGGAVDPQTISVLMGRGLIATDSHGRAGITASGAALIRRRLADGDGFVEQHQERGRITLDDSEFGRRQATVNHDESPLAWLRRRKDRSGRPMIEASEFAAGERLRADYDRAHLMPRVTANWAAAVAGKRRASGSNGVANLTESALGARRRVEAALGALEPELAGLAVDFCCFLKGLEQIEHERQWPARSAKVVLRLALAALARHYGLAAKVPTQRRSVTGVVRDTGRQWTRRIYTVVLTASASALIRSTRARRPLERWAVR